MKIDVKTVFSFILSTSEGTDCGDTAVSFLLLYCSVKLWKTLSLQAFFSNFQAYVCYVHQWSANGDVSDFFTSSLLYWIMQVGLRSQVSVKCLLKCAFSREVWFFHFVGQKIRNIRCTSLVFFWRSYYCVDIRTYSIVLHAFKVKPLTNQPWLGLLTWQWFQCFGYNHCYSLNSAQFAVGLLVYFHMVTLKWLTFNTYMVEVGLWLPWQLEPQADIQDWWYVL